MKNLTFLFILFSFLVPNQVAAVQSARLQTAEIPMELTIKNIKKQKKGKAKGKGIRNTPSFLSALFGIGSLGAVIASIVASFALSTGGVIVFAILGAGLGVLAMINGFKGIRLAKDNPDLKGSQGGALIGLFIGGLSLLALLAMTLGVIFG